MSIEKKIFSVKKFSPSLYDRKRWYLRIQVLDYNKGSFKWQKLYADINKYTTIEDKLAECERITKEIELTGQYVTNQGSRIPTLNTAELFYTDVIHQFNQSLEFKKIGLRPGTYSKYKGQIKVFQNYLTQNGLKHLPIGKLSTDICKDFLDKIILEKLQSNNTYNSYLILFKSFFEGYITQKKVISNPFAPFKKLAKQSTSASYFSKNLADKIKAYATEHDAQAWLFIQFIYYCFIRPKELRDLQIKHIKFDSQQICIPATISKNKKTQYVAIPSVLFAQIKGWEGVNENWYLFSENNYTGAEQVGVNAMKNRHRKILDALQISKEYKLYGWKHTGAVNFTRAGGNLKDLQLQLRHHSLDQVNQYMQSMMAVDSEFIKNNFPTI